MTVYSSNTSLILTDLLTSGQNYSFAVAVIDSTGQHGPWSDQLMVPYYGRYNIYAEGGATEVYCNRAVCLLQVFLVAR